MADAEGGPRRPNPFQIVVALVVVSAVILGYIIATLPARPSDEGLRAQLGDTVAVDYIGFFEDGRVFDTSLGAVAEDNASYPKAVSFQPRSQYGPLRFVVTGGTAEATVIQGFEEGVVGLRVGDTRLVEVSPEKGYGLSNPSLLESRPLELEFPQRESMEIADFNNRYQGSAEAGLTVEDPFWQWNVTVVSLTAHFVTVLHVPEVASVVHPWEGWPVRVVDVDSGANGGMGVISLRHLLAPGDADNVQGRDAKGTFRVVAVDPGAGTYTVDYNPEVVGRTLFFEMTLVILSRP